MQVYPTVLFYHNLLGLNYIVEIVHECVLFIFLLKLLKHTQDCIHPMTKFSGNIDDDSLLIVRFTTRSNILIGFIAAYSTGSWFVYVIVKILENNCDTLWYALFVQLNSMFVGIRVR